uniref:Putative rabx1 n=1 Tax=Corethrella appendiculata TaxID=1370023 RepID=U5EU60_9DIPT
MKAIEAKIVILGSQGVGKTSLVVRYISNVYTNEVPPTIGASFFTGKVNIDDFKVKMQIWDTAGQERFKAMAPLYYRNANAALLVFDISQYNSFNDIKTWVHELQRNVQEPMVLSLVGNKLDLDEKRAVSREEASLYASSIGSSYFETSALQDQGIEQVFITIALGLIRLSGENVCTSLKRYESSDSLIASISTQSNGMNGIVQMGIPVDSDSNVITNGTGRLEMPSWSIDNVAHADSARAGWCCY